MRAIAALAAINLTLEGLYMFKKALGLFEEALARNVKPMSNIAIAVESMGSLKKKVEFLSSQPRMLLTVDSKEARIMAASLNMLLVDLLMFDRPDEEHIKNCRAMIALFTSNPIDAAR